MDEVYELYRKSGLIIVEIHCDNEFYKVMDSFTTKKDPPVEMNYAST